ncbi:unnamed protein product [Amoebophrya sp. A120]|nr:unnamed protein product [Amoebophrya sp. A120]|eukprot:GSA120T00019178001.1
MGDHFDLVRGPSRDQDQLSPDDLEYRAVLDGLIPLVSEIIDAQGGLCSLGFVMNDDRVKAQLARVPTGFDKKITKILRFYNEYFAIIDNGMVATSTGFETGKVVFNNAGQTVAANAASVSGENLGTATTSGPSGYGKGAGGKGSGGAGKGGRAPGGGNETTDQKAIQDAADRLWNAVFDIADEDKFAAAIGEVNYVRKKLWEKGILHLPTPDSLGAGALGGAGGTNHDGGIGHIPFAGNVTHLVPGAAGGGAPAPGCGGGGGINSKAVSAAAPGFGNPTAPGGAGAPGLGGPAAANNNSCTYAAAPGFGPAPGFAANSQHNSYGSSSYNHHGPNTTSPNVVNNSACYDQHGYNNTSTAAHLSGSTSHHTTTASAAHSSNNPPLSLEKRDGRMAVLGQACVDFLAQCPEKTVLMQHLSSDPQITELKRGVVAKFEKWIKQNEHVFRLKEVHQGGTVKTYINLHLEPNENGEMIFPSAVSGLHPCASVAGC